MHVSRWRAPSKPMRSSASTGSIPTLVDDSDDAASDHHPSTPENNDCEQVSTPRVAIGTDTNGVHEQPPVSDEEDEVEDVAEPDDDEPERADGSEDEADGCASARRASYAPGSARATRAWMARRSRGVRASTLLSSSPLPA